MAQPEREPKRAGTWREAALGGVLLALGGALFGMRRGAGASRGAAEQDGAARSAIDRAKVRTAAAKPEAPLRTRYWPPPAPPSPDVYDDGTEPPAQEDAAAHLPVDAASEKRGYERFDAKPGTIVKVMLSSAVVIVCAIAGLFYLIGRQHRADRQSAPLTEQQLTVIVPPGPHLQDHPLHDIAVENKREADLLAYYAWTGPDHRTGRIPIARAQALVVGRPLDPLPPAQPLPAPAPASNP